MNSIHWIFENVWVFLGVCILLVIGGTAIAKVIRSLKD